ncbi:MAG TPA: acyl-CoA dehydrogenase family protein [Capillimicrobium sp.]|nr:acyl-CoA dehydrogenase family protein [Capillimicrobium sp.]
MNLALSDEQELLREAARGTLSRVATVEAARAALEGGTLPDLWPAACEAGWSGLLVSEDNGGAGLGPFDAMLVLGECGRVLAGVPLLGHLPASWLLDRGGWDGVEAIAAGERRAAFVAAMPPGDLDAGWTWDAPEGKARVPAGGDTASWVIDAPGADIFVVVGEGGAVTVVEGATVEAVTRYDATRSLGHVSLAGAAATPLDVSADDAAAAWHLAQALIAAESLGTVETCLDLAVAYAKERYTFGRAIGSYQAIKHQLVEVLRLLENGRSLLYYAGWAGESKPDELALAASAARSVAGRALDHATRVNISVHGGIGATWEHDAPLYFRRAQLSRRLLGGTGAATDRVAGEVMAALPA